MPSIDAIGQYVDDAPQADAYRNVATFYASRMRSGDAFLVDTAQHMVDRIGQRLGPGLKIDRLRIFGHGAPGFVQLGRLTRASVDATGQISIPGVSNSAISEDLARIIMLGPEGGIVNGHNIASLRERFESGGWCELHCCNVAAGQRGKNLLQALADLWNVNVVGSEDLQYPGGGLEGARYVARPNGVAPRRVH